MPEFIQIENDGPEIIATNYFETEHAKRGILYVSGNARCFRILLPLSMLDQLLEMQTGRSAKVERTNSGLRIWFLDGSDAPYCIEVLPGQCDRMPADEDAGRDDLRLAVWGDGPAGPEKLLSIPAEFCA